MTITELPSLDRMSSTFKADVDLFFSEKLPALVTEINAMLSGGVATTSMVGFRNKLHNSSFQVNQRLVSGTITISANSFGHDRWKAGASGCSYTFEKVANVVTITISSGTLKQVIDGADLQSGEYILGWDGTAQGRINSGTYAASPVVGTVLGGENLTVEFGAGTLSFPQFESGTIRTAIDARPSSIELLICQRFYYQLPIDPSGEICIGQALTTTNAYAVLKWPVQMRSSPTVTQSGSGYRLGGEVVSSFSNINTSASGMSFSFGPSTSFSVSGAVVLVQDTSPTSPVYSASADI